MAATVPTSVKQGPDGDVYISVDAGSFDLTSQINGKVIRVSFD